MSASNEMLLEQINELEQKIASGEDTIPNKLLLGKLKKRLQRQQEALNENKVLKG